MLVPLLVVLAQAPLPPNHPPPSGAAAPSADELVKKLDSTAGLKESNKPFEIAASLGRLYFGQGRYGDARTYYLQAVAGAEAARTLYLAQKKAVGAKALPSAADVGCTPGPDATLAQLEAKAAGLAKAKNAPGAVACLKAALAPLMEVEVMLGHAQFLAGDTAGAVATYGRALETFEANVDARYARAAALLDTQGDDVKALATAKTDFERVLADAPTSPRAANAKRLLARTTAALDAGGLSKLQPAPVAAAPTPAPQAPVLPPQLTPEMMAAFQNAPRTQEMEGNFQKLIEEGEEHLARGRFQEALGNYKQVMPYQPNNPRLRAGMAWTMIKLNRQPMADNVWRAATETPDAISALGDTLKAKGDAEGAKAVWQRLKESVPAYAPKLEGKL